MRSYFFDFESVFSAVNHEIIDNTIASQGYQREGNY